MIQWYNMQALKNVREAPYKIRAQMMSLNFEQKKDRGII